MPETSGWFNAHCHLELSFLKGRIPPGTPFVFWLRELVRLRREVPMEEQIAAARAALSEMAAAGTTHLFDILRVDLTDALLREGSVQALMFREAICFDPKEGFGAVMETLQRQQQHGPLPPHCQHGLSPHAVYTTTGPLLRAAAHHAAASGQWLCIHAAETPEEEEFCRSGTGPLHEMLSPFLPGDWTPPRMGSIRWLDLHGCLGPRTLLVHCNQIDDADLALIAERGCSVVVCPGTHVYFRRGAFPLARLMAAGIPVYLGTDSLASNEALDMAREVELALELCPGVDCAALMEVVRPAAARRFIPASR
jgi:cytosine/adenosine deaminase-related metal-dependent hydrolase